MKVILSILLIVLKSYVCGTIFTSLDLKVHTCNWTNETIEATEEFLKVYNFNITESQKIVFDKKNDRLISAVMQSDWSFDDGPNSYPTYYVITFWNDLIHV
jgi:hypothetical protein